MDLTESDQRAATTLTESVARAIECMADTTLPVGERDEAIIAAVAAGERLDAALVDVAADPAVSASTLARLGLSAHRWLPVGVAGNPSTSTETLDVLLLNARSDDSDLRRTVARNPNTHPESLEHLADVATAGDCEKPDTLLSALAANPASTARVLNRVLDHPLADDELVAAVVLHPNADPGLRTDPQRLHAVAAVQGGLQAPDRIPADIEVTAWSRVLSISYDHQPADAVDLEVAAGQRLGDAFREHVGEPSAAVRFDDGGGRFQAWTLDSSLGVGFRFLSGPVLAIESAPETDRSFDL